MKRLGKWLGPHKAIEIVEEDGVRVLQIGGSAIQSAMRLDAPDRIELDYVRAMMAFLIFHPSPRGIQSCFGSEQFLAGQLDSAFRAFRDRFGRRNLRAGRARCDRNSRPRCDNARLGLRQVGFRARDGNFIVP